MCVTVYLGITVSIIVLEVESRFKTEQLEKILLQLKSLSADEKLSEFIVVLSSSSFTALGLTIGRTELRSWYIEVVQMISER